MTRLSVYFYCVSRSFTYESGGGLWLLNFSSVVNNLISFGFCRLEEVRTHFLRPDVFPVLLVDLLRRIIYTSREKSLSFNYSYSRILKNEFSRSD